MYKLGNISTLPATYLHFRQTCLKMPFQLLDSMNAAFGLAKSKLNVIRYTHLDVERRSLNAPPRSWPLLQLLQLVPALESAAGGAKTSFEYVKQHG